MEKTVREVAQDLRDAARELERAASNDDRLKAIGIINLTTTELCHLLVAMAKNPGDPGRNILNHGCEARGS